MIGRRELLGIGSAALVSCARSDGAYFGSTDPPKARRLVHTLPGEIETLDPAKSTTSTEFWVIPALLEGLIQYHPEYSKLHYAETVMKPAYDWLDKLQNCTSYQQALDSGYSVPVNKSTGTVNDPYFLLTGTTADKDTIDHELYQSITYKDTTITIWQIANSSVLCNTTDSAHRMGRTTVIGADGFCRDRSTDRCSISTRHRP